MSVLLALASAYAATQPSEVARLLEAATEPERAELLQALDEPTVASVLAETTPRLAAEALARLPHASAAKLLASLAPQAAAALLLRLSAQDVDGLLALLPETRRAQLRKLTEYGASRAGGRLEPRAVSVPEDLSVADALQWVMRAPDGVLFYVYVLGEAQVLIGVLTLRELMQAEGSARVDTIMTRDPERLHASDTLERIARHPAWRRVHALPVVEEGGQFLGALRYSAFRSIESELRLSAVGPDPSRSASALAELYGLSASALVQWVSTTLLPPSARDQEPAP